MLSLGTFLSLPSLKTLGYIVIAIAIAAFIGAVYYSGYNYRDRQATVEHQEDLIERAKIEAKFKDKMKNAEVQHELDKQSIITKYDALVNSLRTRPVRNTETACSGASGAQLSREDAEFLAWEATRAEECRNELSLWYKYGDSLEELRNHYAKEGN